MLSERPLAVALSAVAGMLLWPAMAFAQAPVNPTQAARNPDRSLLPLLEKVTWDPARRGPLLIVAPESTLPFRERRQSLQWALVIRGPEPRPIPGPDGSYRLADLGEIFGRQARTVGKSLTVFAPTTMTTLSGRLPKPDPYTGMGMSEKLRLLQSTLTPAQWETIGSAAGIGAGDLDRRQRELFLSLLPEPFVVWPTRRGENGERVLYYDSREKGVTLTPAQRQGVRLSLRRAMDWSFRSVSSVGFAGNVGIGVPADDGAQYELHGSGFGSSGADNRDEIFGIPLLEDVPARLKPGHLPFSWTALNAAVPLDGVATVGELVRRAAARTHVPLYCDPRYADLSVYMRSNEASVRAGDLLQALCLGVTGTFRKVGGDEAAAPAAYVMTDDLEGLGARHARVQAWASANATLAQQRREEVADALAKASVGDHIGWAESDPLRPGADLDRRIEEFRKNRNDPAASPAALSARPGAPLTVSVTELPTPAQEVVRRQLESYQRIQESRKNDPFYAEHPEAASSLQTDRVVMNVQVRASFVVPGMGAISSEGSGFSSDAAQSLLSDPRRRPFFGSMYIAPAGPVPIPSAYAVRALVIAVQNAGEAVRAVAAAAKYGLNQVWIEVVPDGAETSNAALIAAISAGKEAKVSVGAIVRLLRLRPASNAGASVPNPLPKDRNILGETTAEFAKRRAGMPFAAATSQFVVLPPTEDSARLRRLGDWLLPDEPDVRAAAEKRAATIAAIPGLSGIVLRDAAAPGYEGSAATYSPYGSLDVGEQMGYTTSMRLAFLQESGVDPLDLSPLPQGAIRLPFGTISYSSTEMRLPFFPDYGPSAENYSINGQKATELGAKDAADRWKKFRAAKSTALTEHIVQAVRARQPNLIVRVQRGADGFEGGPQAPFFDLWPMLPTGTKSAPPAADTLFTVRCAPFTGNTGSSTTGADSSNPSVDEFFGRLSGAMTGPIKRWHGVVLDLSELPVERALPLLSRLQPSTIITKPGAGNL